jgi:WD40 repeat protein
LRASKETCIIPTIALQLLVHFLSQKLTWQRPNPIVTVNVVNGIVLPYSPESRSGCSLSRTKCFNEPPGRSCLACSGLARCIQSSRACISVHMGKGEDLDDEATVQHNEVEDGPYYNDFGNLLLNENRLEDETTITSSSSMWQSLRARQQALQRGHDRWTQRWLNGDCTTSIAVALRDNWVRRVAVDIGMGYPLAVCGSATDDLYITNLETGQILAQTENNPQEALSVVNQQEQELWEKVSRTLYGTYDGGGTISVVCVDGGRQVLAATRSGGVQVWWYDSSQKKLDSAAMPKSLVLKGTIPGLDAEIVTCLYVDDNGQYLTVGTAKGVVHTYALRNAQDTDGDDYHSTYIPLEERSSPDFLWLVGSGSIVTSVCCTTALGTSIGRPMVVATTSSGSVECLAMEASSDVKDKGRSMSMISGHRLIALYPPFDSSVRRPFNTFPLCATIVKYGISQFALVIGGSDGSLFQQPLQTQLLEATGTFSSEHVVDCKHPFGDNSLRVLRPRHAGPVKCLVNPSPGLLVTGAVDGSVRIWNIDQLLATESKAENASTDSNNALLYQFRGYKVWLGSLWTDGRRLVSDGADNTIIVHDFGVSSIAARAEDPFDPQ